MYVYVYMKEVMTMSYGKDLNGWPSTVVTKSTSTKNSLFSHQGTLKAEEMKLVSQRSSVNILDLEKWL